jgi:hypothetical protein
MGSKIIAIFISCYTVKDFQNILLINDNYILLPNFPVVISCLNNEVRYISYIIKSIRLDSLHRLCYQQAQDLKYKLSGLT